MPESKEQNPGIKWKPPNQFLSEDDDPDEEWGMEHCRILYLISKYANAAQLATDEETWIRQIPLSVLLYEGIVAGVIDLDYAPVSCLVSHHGVSRRLWMNVSQEEDFQPVTAFQASEKGIAFIKILPTQVKNEVDKFLHSTDGTIFKIEYNNSKRSFVLHTESGERKESNVTETEDVSYVSSPLRRVVL
eukprot:GSMAST32.ASY1.ANO1.1523.1 assembled CDS